MAIVTANTIFRFGLVVEMMLLQNSDLLLKVAFCIIAGHLQCARMIILIVIDRRDQCFSDQMTFFALRTNLIAKSRIVFLVRTGDTDAKSNGKYNCNGKNYPKPYF